MLVPNYPCPFDSVVTTASKSSAWPLLRMLEHRRWQSDSTLPGLSLSACPTFGSGLHILKEKQSMCRIIKAKPPCVYNKGFLFWVFVFVFVFCLVRRKLTGNLVSSLKHLKACHDKRDSIYSAGVPRHRTKKSLQQTLTGHNKKRTEQRQ